MQLSTYVCIVDGDILVVVVCDVSLICDICFGNFS